MDLSYSLDAPGGEVEEDDDDVIRFLPALKNDGGAGTAAAAEDCMNGGGPIKMEALDEGDGWYTAFLNDIKDDIDRQKLHELVADYLICGGYQEAAELLCADAEMKFPNGPPAAETLEKRNQIRNHIVGGEMDEAMRQIEALAPELLKSDEKIHFKLLRQQLVELIRAKELDKVLDFASQHLTDKCQQPPELLTKLEQTYALLAFDQPENSPFGYLMSPSQRNMLANEVNSAILAALNKNPDPVSKLEQLLRFMVWNQHQYLSKGDSHRPASQEITARIAKELFATEEDPASDML